MQFLQQFASEECVLRINAKIFAIAYKIVHGNIRELLREAHTKIRNRQAGSV
jgi:hypothetical protein